MLKLKQKNRIEVGSEIHLRQSLANRKTGTSFSAAKKLIFMLIAVAVFLSTGIAAMTGFTPQAHAIKVDPISDMICPTVSNGTAYLGGTSQPIINGFEGNVGKAPWEGLFGVWTIPQVDRDNIAKGSAVQHEWTTLERYGYYGTEYTNWVGMQTHYPLERLVDEVFSDGKLPFMGTGGNPGGFGAFMYLEDGSVSPLFSQNLLDCIPIASHAVIAGANTFQAINQSISAITLNFYAMSSNLSLSDENSMLRPLGEVFETLIAGDGNTKGLKDILFLDFMLPLIMGGAIIIFFRYIRTWSMLKVMQQVLWILFIGVLGMILLSNPLFISSTVDKVVNTVTGAMSGAILGTGERSPECKLSSGEPQKVEREMSCHLWVQNVYAFWVQGQFDVPYEEGVKMTSDPAEKEGVVEFGEPDDADTYVGLNASNWAGINKNSYSSAITTEDGETKTGSQNFLALTALGYDPRSYYPDYESMFNNSKPVASEPRADGKRGALSSFNPHLGKKRNASELRNWPYYQMDTSATWPVSNGYNHSEVAFNQLVIENNTYWKHPTNAGVISFISLGYSIVPNIVTFLFSLTLITLQISLTMLIILAPFFLTLGLLPGFGARIFYKWANLLTGVTVRRIIVTFFFFLYLKLYFIILDSTMTLMTKLLVIVILSLVLFSMREQLASAVVKALQIGDGKQDMSESEKLGYAKALAFSSGASTVVNKMRTENRKQDRWDHEQRRKDRKAMRRLESKKARQRHQNTREESNVSQYYDDYLNSHNEAPRSNYTLSGEGSQPYLVAVGAPQPTVEPGMALPGGSPRFTGPREEPIDVSSLNSESYTDYGFEDPQGREAYMKGYMEFNDSQYHDQARQQSRADLRKLTNEEKLALSIYTTEYAHGTINSYLHGEKGRLTDEEYSGAWDAVRENQKTLEERIADNTADATNAEVAEQRTNEAIAEHAELLSREFGDIPEDRMKEYLKTLDIAQAKLVSDNPEIVFRGVDFGKNRIDSSHEDFLAENPVGTTMRFDGQTSTSASPKIAGNWGNDAAIFEIKTKSGAHVSDVSVFGEAEVLVSSGNYTVVGNHLITRDDGRKTAVVQLVEVDEFGAQK